MNKNIILNELFKLCEKAYKKNDVPIAAIIVKNNKIIAKAYNKKNICNIPYYHAEILVIKKACKKLKSWNLSDCEMYVSLKPCKMCENIINESRIQNVFYLLEKDNNDNLRNCNIEQMFADNAQKNKFKKILINFFKSLR